MNDSPLNNDVQQGIKAHRAGNIKEAQSIYKAILKIQPKHPDVNHNMGVLLVGLNQIEAALPFFEIALKADPGKAQFWLSHINALISLKKIVEANKVLKQARDVGAKGPGFDNLEHKLHRLHKVTSKHKESLETGSFDLGTLKLDQALKLARARTKDGLDSEAKLIYQAILKKFPSNKTAKNKLKFLETKVISPEKKAVQEPSLTQQNLIAELFREKKFELAHEQCTQLLKFFPNSIFLGNVKGAIFKAVGRFADAIETYEELLKVAPNNPNIFHNLGIAFLEQGDLEPAMEAQVRALQINPHYAEAQFAIGTIFRRRGRLEQAIAAYRNAIIIEPNYADALFNMANAHSDQGQLIDAIEAYKRVLKLKSDDPNAMLNIGIAYKKLGNTVKAIKFFEQLITDRPKNIEAHFNLGDTFTQQGEPQRAIGSLKSVLSLDPNHAEAHNSMGNALWLLGEAESAVDSYKKALALRPNFKAAWDNILFPLQKLKLDISSEKIFNSYLPEKSTDGSELELAILNYKLCRGRPNSAKTIENVVGLLSSLDDTTIQKPQDIETSMPPAKVINKVVALKHFGRSGTGLLHSLIDGHSEISTLPSIYLSQFFDRATWEKITSDGWENMVDRFIEIYDVLFDARSSVPVAGLGDVRLQDLGVLEGMTNLGENKDEFLSLDRSKFRQEFNLFLNSVNSIDQATFFKLLHSAYEKVLNKTSEKKFIFYHIHNPSPDAELRFIQSVKDMRWMVMVREPVQSYESWITKSFSKGRYEELAQKLRAMLFEIDNIAYLNNSSIGVKLEDLKSRPTETIGALCNWFGISKEDSLYEMTAQKKKWWGDPSSPDFSKDGMNPFGTAPIDRKVGALLSKSDQLILRTLFYPFSARFGYVEENQDQFKRDLQSIRPHLDMMFDFEKDMLENFDLDPGEHMASGPCINIRSTLIERWNTLNKFGTYHNLLTPLIA